MFSKNQLKLPTNNSIGVKFLLLSVLFLNLMALLNYGLFGYLEFTFEKNVLEDLIGSEAQLLRGIAVDLIENQNEPILQNVLQKWAQDDFLVYVAVLDQDGSIVVESINWQTIQAANIDVKSETNISKSSLAKSQEVLHLREKIYSGDQQIGELQIGYTDFKIANQFTRNLIWGLLGSLLISLPLSVIALLILRKAIVWRLGFLIQKAEAFTRLDFSEQFAVYSQNDELGKVELAIHTMANSLQKTIIEYQEASSLLTAINQIQEPDQVDAEIEQLVEKTNTVLMNLAGSSWAFCLHIPDENAPAVYKHLTATTTKVNEENHTHFASDNIEADIHHYLISLITPIIKSKQFYTTKTLPPASLVYIENQSLQGVIGIPLLQWDQVIGIVGIANSGEREIDSFLNYITPVLATCSNALQKIITKETQWATEEHLRQSDLRTQTILKTAVDGIITIDQNGFIETMNPAALSIFGYEDQEIIGKKVDVLMPPPFQSRHGHYMQNFMETGIQKIIGIGREVQGLRKDGTVFPMDLSVNEVILPDRCLFTGFIRDITERKQTRNELQSQRDFAQLVMQTMGQGLIVLDKEGMFTFANPTFTQMIGAPAQNLIGKKHSEYIDIPSNPTNISETRSQESIIRSLDGINIPVLITGVPLIQAGEVTGSIIVFTNLTDTKEAQKSLRESEERARQILEKALDAVISIDDEGKIISWNAQAEATFGWSPQEMIGSYLFESIIPHSMRSAHQQGMENYLRTGEGPVLNKRFEITALNKDGQTLPIELTILPHKIGKKHVFSSFLRDITTQKEAEEAIADARDKALEASRLKSEFLAMMSHEIRTPMNSIIGLSEALHDTPLDEEQQEFLEIITSEAYALLAILNSILDFSRIEAGKVVLDITEFNPVDIIEGAVGTFVLKAHEKNISLVSFVDPKVPTRVKGDAGRIRQILINIIGNAVKFTHEGEIQVQVAPYSITPDQVIIELIVSDTGIGMDTNTLDILFDPFIQEDSSTTRKYGGTGLGMAITKRLVNIMGGDITVVSQKNQGSTFTIKLPLQTIRSESPPPDFPVKGLFALGVLAQPTERILMDYLNAWDIPNSFFSSTAALEDWLANNLQTTSGYAIFFEDDGHRDSPPEIPAFFENYTDTARLGFFILTPFEQQHRGKQAISLGYTNYLQKPMKQMQLKNTLVEFATTQQIKTKKQKTSKLTNNVEANTPPTILVAEDNLSSQKTVQAQLKSLGYQAVIVNNGREVVEAYQNSQGEYKLILMDIQMPEMSGLSAARKIRELSLGTPNPIPILAMSANTMPEDVENATQAGMNGYIMKPVTLAALRSALMKWLPDSENET